MADQNNDRISLVEVKAILANKGLRPIDYKHLNEAGMRKLAGVK